MHTYISPQVLLIVIGGINNEVSCCGQICGASCWVNISSCCVEPTRTNIYVQVLVVVCGLSYVSVTFGLIISRRKKTPAAAAVAAADLAAAATNSSSSSRAHEARVGVATRSACRSNLSTVCTRTRFCCVFPGSPTRNSAYFQDDKSTT